MSADVYDMVEEALRGANDDDMIQVKASTLRSILDRMSPPEAVPERPAAIMSMAMHHRLGHEGAWGECERYECVEDRKVLKAWGQ